MMTGDARGVEWLDRLPGCVKGVWGRGTKPAARMFGETIHRASTAPREWRASWAGDRVGRFAAFFLLGDGDLEAWPDATSTVGVALSAEKEWLWSERSVFEEV